jgi:D-alanine-D-alanine ligase
MKIIMLVHPDLVPPEDVDESQIDWSSIQWATEYDVKKALLAMGHDVVIVDIFDSLAKIRLAIKEYKPAIVFNLLEEFRGEALFDQNVVSYLELLGVPYTGSNPKGLIIGRDKALSKKILAYHKIPTPKFQVFPRNNPRRKINLKSFPAIVKCLNEEASLGLSQSSVVSNPEKLKERVQYVQEKFRTDAIAEQFIEGKEYFVGVLGNYRLETLPVWELKFSEAEHPEKEFYSTKAKFSYDYRERKGISTGPAELGSEQTHYLQNIAKRAYKCLGLNGYARMDLRVDQNGKAYLLEANPNPDISEFDDFAESAKLAGYTYHELLDKILRLGRAWSPIH